MLANAQNVGINSTGTAPNTSSMLDVSSTSSGLLIPRMTAVQRNALSSPATGLLVFQTDTREGFYYYDGTVWNWLFSGDASVDSDADVEHWIRPSGANFIQPEFNRTSAIKSISIFDEGEDVGISVWCVGTGTLVGILSQYADVAADFYGVFTGMKVGVDLTSSTTDNAIECRGDINITYGSIEYGTGAGGLEGGGNIDCDGITSSGEIIGVDLNISGTKNFFIDHPKDPENKILKHSCIESNEILNEYRGNITLSEIGEGAVELPNYFEDININFSYHLTPIGAAAPNLHVKQEVKNNSFVIAGGEPNMKVSWTVKAERNDKHMQKYPEKRNMEIEKSNDKKGLYLDNNAYDMPIEKSYYFVVPPSESSEE